jgi:hypothetical protein
MLFSLYQNNFENILEKQMKISFVQLKDFLI